MTFQIYAYNVITLYEIGLFGPIWLYLTGLRIYGKSRTSRLGNVRNMYIDANDDDHECSAIA
jgi:hypothetical protein